MTAGTGSWDAAWDAALDAMELEADEVERLLRHRDISQLAQVTAGSFQPPTNLGPLPYGLAERARRLLQRQLDLSTELGLAIAGNRAQAKLLSHMHRDRPDAVPVFVDSRS